MAEPEHSAPQVRRLTPRGAATRDRIVQAAAELMLVKGVNATTLDDVRAASSTSKSQLYHHFADKDALVHEVIAVRAKEILTRERQRLERLNSFRGLQRWRTALVHAAALRHGAYGCALGSMANELADQDEVARSALAQSFTVWGSLIADGLRRMQANGSLQPTADPDTLATGLLAALQGGYLLADTAHDVRPMEIALDMALDQVKTLLVTG
ncbi:MAG TPA: TetR/AcrR family transcriptional regulator [Pseudonocardiaceae bacterium]|nr:TetR/AcrR family transcriptional regulator [Pseudonocardiaceae bacterium]